MRRIFSAVLLAAALCLTVPVALSAATEEDLKPRFIARDGDIAKLMALQTATPDPAAAEIAARILAITR